MNESAAAASTTLVGWAVAADPLLVGVVLAGGALALVALGFALGALATRAQAGRRDAALRDAFKALSADALRASNEAFLTLAAERLGKERELTQAELEQRKQAVDALVRPIGETLGKMDAQLREVEKEWRGQHEAIRAHLELVQRTSAELRDETASLVRALRTPNVCGRWGEIQLRRVVEMAGMLDYCDFTEQETVTTGEGRRLRPDLLVRLPGGKQVVMDAKTPLDAYLDAVEAADDATRATHLVRHARQVRDHINQLSAKQYWTQFESAPEFVVLFLPGETFFHDALAHDPTLIEHGVQAKVIPASPTTLIALLRAVAYGWREEKLAANAEAIRALGSEMHERIASFVGHFAAIGKRLDGAIGAYNNAVGSLESRVLVSARKLKDLGAAAGEDIDEIEPVERRTRGLRDGP